MSKTGIAPRQNFKWNKTLDDSARGKGSRAVLFGALSGSNDTEKKERLLGSLNRNMQCKSWNMPIIDNVTIHYDGPLTTAEVQASFGTKINLLGASEENPPPGASAVDSTMADPGKYQTFAIICAIQWRMDFDPAMFVAKIQSLTTPTASEAKPVVPDVFASQIGGAGSGDTAASGVLGLTAAQTMLPGYLQWAYWVEAAMFYMTRGYNLYWQYGHNYNILNDSLRYTAFVPTNAQEGSASNSEQSVLDYIRRVNNYYTGTLNSTQIALMPDRLRAGNESLGGTAGLSVFHPSRALETVGITYGGGGLRPMLRGNTEFRRLDKPFLAWPGAAIGLYAQEQATDDAGQMRAFLDATSPNVSGLNGTGTPAVLTEHALINSGNTIATTAGVTGVEPSLDSGGSVANTIGLNSQRVIYKGSPWRLTTAMKGWELTPDQALLLNDADYRAQVEDQCKCKVFTSTGG